MTTNSSFQDLRIWQESMDLTVQIYRTTSGFPKHETYGLTSQMRRAAVSFFTPGDLYWNSRPSF